MIEACTSLMSTDKEFTGPVNLGNPNEFSIKELANMVVELTGSKSDLVFEPLPVDDPKQRCPDISLAKSRLNWEPRVSLETGLKKTISYFDDFLRQS